ncbi:uncharacterized protein G2W53_007679 [Senna tora]|uniref:Uncharacterized protein n=1 Tax=Senna tora TaxID=362788 RepID=A0A834X6P4_9FABA|nr:uncharacterized protein G2W53_007679 [Senna tora]
MGGAWTMSSYIPDNKLHSDLRNLHELRGKRLVAQLSETRRFVLYLRTGVDLMFQLELSSNGRSVDHVLTYSGRKIVVGSQKPSRITRQRTCCANDKSRSDLRNLQELRGKRHVAQVSQTHRNLQELRGKSLVEQLSETRRFALYLQTGVDLMFPLELSSNGRSVDHVLSYSGQQIVIKSQKPSRNTRQKTCCINKSNMSVRDVFSNRSGFDVPIGIVMAWEERGSCLNLFWMTNRGRISETFMNYETKDLLRN